MVYPWVYHYASHFPHYICCVQHGLKWWSSADYIISWHYPNEVAHRDGAGPRFGQGRFWTFWFGSTTSVIQLRKTNVVYIFVLVFIFLGFDQHNSRVSCKFSLSKWESGGSTLKCHGFKLESGQAIVGAMSIYIPIRIYPSINSEGFVGSFLKNVGCFWMFWPLLYLPSRNLQQQWNPIHLMKSRWFSHDECFLNFGSCSLGQCPLVQIVYPFWKVVLRAPFNIFHVFTGFSS